MSNLGSMLSNEVKGKMYDTIKGTAPVLKFPNMDIIKTPVRYSKTAYAWICRATRYTFCKRNRQSELSKPDCENCALRRCGL